MTRQQAGVNVGSFDFDQAEGLRRMLAGAKPRIFTFVSATTDDEKNAMLVNLSASLVCAGSDVLLMDATHSAGGIASRLRAKPGATLLDVARQERALDEVVQLTSQGFGVATMSRLSLRDASHTADQARRLGNAFDILVKQTDVLVIDAELDEDDSFPVPAMDAGEIIVQVSTSATSITEAYSIIKRLYGRLGRRPFSVLVTGASDREAQVVYANMEQAASRYLAVQLNSLGSVPADDHLSRASRLGRTVIDAYPLAGASVAFRRLADRFAYANSTAFSLNTGA
jgi:flagellar biosynthesis protein FlhG